MTISFVGSELVNTDGKVPLTLTLPIHQQDDIGLIFGVCDYNGASATMGMTEAHGWTELFQELIGGGRQQRTAVWYKRFGSSGDADPVMEVSLDQENSFSVHIFRGVDTINMFSAAHASASSANVINPTNQPSITTATVASCVVLFHGFTHNELSGVGPPPRYTLGETLPGKLHQGQATAYLLDAGAAGLETPGTWTHSGTLVTQDNRNYTLALKNNKSGTPVPYVHSANSNVAVSSSVSAAMTLSKVAAGSLTATATVSAAVTLSLLANANLNASAIMSGAALATRPLTASLLGTASATGSAHLNFALVATGAMVGTATMSSRAVLSYLSTGNLIGTATVTGNVVLSFVATASLNATATLVGTEVLTVSSICRGIGYTNINTCATAYTEQAECATSYTELSSGTPTTYTPT